MYRLEEAATEPSLFGVRSTFHLVALPVGMGAGAAMSSSLSIIT